MGVDEYYNWAISYKDLMVLLKWSKKYAKKFKFETISNPEGKVYMYIMINFIRNIESRYFGFMMEKEEIYSLSLQVDDVVMLHRMCKIIQLEIGEENEEQQIIQSIQQDLYNYI